MSTSDLRTEKLTIVLLGKFNPQIFQPYWFAKHGLVPDREAEEAKVELVHPEISDFSLEWCHFNIASERLSLDCLRPERYPPVFDLLISTFILLSHTPITAMGINMEYVFRFNEESDWHAFGHRIAPKEYWNDVLEKPGLLLLQMKAQRKDDYLGSCNVTLQSRPPRDVIVSVNDHFQITPEFSLGSILESQRTLSLERSEMIAKTLISK